MEVGGQRQCPDLLQGPFLCLNVPTHRGMPVPAQGQEADPLHWLHLQVSPSTPPRCVEEPGMSHLCLPRSGAEGRGKKKVGVQLPPISSLGSKGQGTCCRWFPVLLCVGDLGLGGGYCSEGCGHRLRASGGCPDYLRWGGDGLLESRPKKSSLFFCHTPPTCTPQEFYQSGASGQGIEPCQAPGAGRFFYVGHAGPPSITSMPRAQPRHSHCPPLVRGDPRATHTNLLLGKFHTSGCEELGDPDGEDSGCFPSSRCYKYVITGSNRRAEDNSGCTEAVI